MSSDYRAHAQRRLEKALAEVEKWKLVLQGLDEIDQSREGEGEQDEEDEREASGTLAVMGLRARPNAARLVSTHIRHGKRQTLPERIWTAVEALSPNEFTVPEIEEWLREHQGYVIPGRYARSRIATVLKDLRRQKKVVRTAAPTGGEPHRYKKIDDYSDLLGTPAVQ